MKKSALLLTAMLWLGASMNAQTILSEDFETGNKGENPQPVASGSGWTTVNGYNGSTTKYNWHNYYSDPNGEYTSATITGDCCAGVDAPFISQEDGAGPREEVLLTPELNLNDDYQLEFKFKVSPVNHSEGQRYDLQVRVVSGDNLAGAETIFSIQNEKMLRESGVVVFPIDDWNVYTAKVGLEDFKGENVKIAFVYKLLDECGNAAWVDDVVVKKYTPVSGPKASLSMDRLDFGSLYVGEKFYSDVITLTNIGKDGLTINSVDLPEGLGLSIDPASVNLNSYQHVDFRVSYTASMASPANGNVVFHTNGGDVTLNFTAAKQFVPDGCTLELFEDYYPPAGWESKYWSWINSALEGEHSVYSGGDFGASTLRSPRLDLTNGGTLKFTYINRFDDDGYPEYDIEVQVSTDGGKTWSTKWVTDYQNGLNKVLTAEVDLGTGTDNSYVRWFYPAVETSDEGAAPHSTFYMDRVLLPKVYGSDGVPTAASSPQPANNSTDIYPRDVNLSWAPAQFAKGYKLYVGTNAAADDLINGVDLGNKLNYTIPECAYSTLYRWKVVAYNDNGDCDEAATWKFTTQPDASVLEYPYIENFEGEGLPTGWSVIGSEGSPSRVWEKNNLTPYVNGDENYGVFYTMWLNSGLSNSIVTPEFQLPDDDSMQISFIWGDNHPRSLMVDASGTVKKNNVEPNNGVSEIKFFIYADGEWNELSYISENMVDEDRKYWINEKIDLTPYKGKRVQFRWTHYSYSYSDDGGALTHVVLERIEGDKAKFNVSSWDAGKVNYEKSTESGEIFTLLNEGVNTLKIKSVSFSTPNFSSTLKAGDEIAVDEGLPFSVRFDALTSDNQIEDDMTVEFESGYKIVLPLSGTALSNGIFYFSFEPNPLDYVWSDEFTMIDADNAPGYSFTSYWVHYSADGQRSAFSLESDSMEDGMYGMMNPVSGTHALVASSGQSVGADNWIISRKMRATESSKFDFWCRNWETLESVLPDPKSNVTVLVSTAGNSDTADFQVEMKKTEIPFQHHSDWVHYEVDLSKYDGQDVYVALRHTTDSQANLAFFDDFTFTGFDLNFSSVENMEVVGEDADIEVYSLGGVLVAKGKGLSMLSDLDRGFYVVRVSENGVVRTLRIAK